MEDVAEAAIDHALRSGAEFADLRMESLLGTIVVVMDGRTKTIIRIAAMPTKVMSLLVVAVVKIFPHNVRM